MKITRKLFVVALVGITVLASVATVQAQDPSAYTLGNWSGGSTTNQAVGPTLSVTNTIATSEYNSAKLVVAVRGDGSSTANAYVKTFRSLDSSLYETTGVTNFIALNGTTEVVTNIDLSETYLANVGTLRVIIENTNAATRSITNITGKVRFNAPSVRLKGS